MIYGTAWKGDDTATLTYEALRNGFRAIDTAAQPEAYREDLTGDGIRRAISEGLVTRDEIYVGPILNPFRRHKFHASSDPDKIHA